jgi:peptide/nickel transport system ATP-binding protein
MTALLSVENLDVGLGAAGPDILGGVSLTLAPGETLGVVGESGSGKSMLALSIMGLQPFPVRTRRGAVRLRGEDLLALPPETMRARRGSAMAMIFQEPLTALNPVMRVGDQIGEVLRWRRSLAGRAARQEAISLMARVEIPDPQSRVDSYPHEMSGGMRQRVMIAMALAGSPGLLIADEPTTALDVTIQAQILDLIRKLQRENGMGVLLITHDLGVIAEMCDRVIVMYGGRVVESGDALDIFDRAAHPYTRGLLASRPKLADEAVRLTTIEGVVPGVGQFPPGCRFAPRCDRARSDCAHEPGLDEIGPTHRVACFHPHATPARTRMQA